MNDLTTIIIDWSSSDSFTETANNVIINYNLHFTVEDIIKAINALRCTFVNRYVQQLLNLTLTTNLRMFIAIVYMALDDKADKSRYNRLVVEAGDNYALGYDTTYHYNTSTSYGATTYCNLYDYYEFDITDLQMPDGVRKQIQNHIDSKRTYTKPAVKPAIKK